jgi:hypothetical protein
MKENTVPYEFVLSPACAAAEADGRIPLGPGYYAIFIDIPHSLPSPFSALLNQRGTRLIYIGIAKRSLHQRLLSQDLLHRKPSTFFRGLGAILGFRPTRGALFGKINQNNYTFSTPDTGRIVDWIKQHLSLSWLEAEPALEQTEQLLIREFAPIINTDHNPTPVMQLSELRAICRDIARADPGRNAGMVSPEYNFSEFCRCMFGKNPTEVMDAASAEITYARRIHRSTTKDRDFRKGSRGQAYCDELMHLISLFVGTVPENVSPEFVNAVQTLALHLVPRVEIIALRKLLARN